MQGKEGVQWAEVGGKVSTMASGKKAWAAAARGAGDEGLAAAIEKEKNWRANYVKHVVRLAEVQAEGKEKALGGSAAGIEETDAQFVFHKDGTVHAMKDVPELPPSTPFTTEEFGGAGDVDQPLQVPVGQEVLSTPEAITAAVEGWGRYGSCEPSFVSTVAAASRTDPRTLVSGHVFLVLGGTSSAGPTLPLLHMGATVAAVARPGKKLETLVNAAKTLPGRLLVPSSGGVRGADVLRDIPEIAAWAAGLETGRKLVIGSYIYLDGEAHVRASVACNAIASTVMKKRAEVALAFLASPSIAHAISKEAADDSRGRYEGAGWGTRLNPLRWCAYRGNYRVPKGGVHVTNGLINFQGPNYALAKTYQTWCAVRARSNGTAASARIAPPMYTESICHVPAAMAGLNGYQAFPPLAAYSPETVAPLMTLVLLWDLTSADSTARPDASLENPMQIMVQNAFHGGSWRCAYEQESIASSLFVLGRFWFGRPSAPPSA